MEKYFKYFLIVALLGLGAFLKSPLVVVSSVLVLALAYAESIFIHKHQVKDVTELYARADAYDKKLKELTADVNNVAERAQTILGDTYR